MIVNGIFTKTIAVRARASALALMLALVCAAAIPGVATAAAEEFAVAGTNITLPTPESTPERWVVAEGPPEMREIPELNITKLRIDPDWYNAELMPGDSDEITVTVTNPNNETVLVDPMIIEDPYSDNPFDEDWIAITPASAELGPDGGEEVFRIAVVIPYDADLGDYDISIAFTDDVMPELYPTPYPSYVNTFYLDVVIWKSPVVQILPAYIDDRVESGKEYDYAVTLKNIGDEAIDIDPEMVDVARYGWYGMMPAFENDAITIDAPSFVPANGTAAVNIHLEVPAGAKGRYDGEINLGIDDPSMGRWCDEGGEVDLNFEVWTQPTEPFIKAFVTDTASPISIEVDSTQGSKWFGACRIDGGDGGDEPYFDLTLEGPNGTATLVPTRITYYGSVSLGGGSRCAPPGEMTIDEAYHEDYTGYTEEYTADGAVGNWELEILPHYVEDFEYTITIEDAGTGSDTRSGVARHLITKRLR
ncbi:MAG: hypothetical protein C4B59_11890 [Candidatus Methanogaster sp.]|uniref:Uncharacterized protein n=1 Tax=Candidatus Methanogaster sp. TaxID=3386292 RepID=A0AC61L0T7_9EURY|nr:MAG: hypothetical protein C4B59_11890 [ANME-2 cluster archaeon]